MLQRERRLPPARRILFIVLQALLMLLVTVGLLEFSLRLFPRLIPAFLLVDFNPGVREAVAERLGLPTEKSVRLLPRDDGGPPRRLRLFRPAAKITWEMRDRGFLRTVQMDPLGFCNPPGARAPGSRADLLALGDSFTFCTGVRPTEAWPIPLGLLLGLSSYNLGSPGIGLYEYLQILEQIGIPMSPRIVVLNFYEGNDLRDALHFSEYRRAVGQGRQAPARRLLKDRPLARHSYAYNLLVVGTRRLHRAVRLLLEKRLGIPSGEEPAPDFRYRLSFPEGAIPFNEEDADADEVRSARSLRAGEIDLGVFREGLETFVELSRRHGFKAIVAYTPSAYTAYADHAVFEDAGLQDLMPWFSRRQREYLAKTGQELGYAFVDLTPALQAAARSLGRDDLLYFPSILHFTARGHAVVAAALAEALRTGTPDGRISAGVQDSLFPPAARKHRP